MIPGIDPKIDIAFKKVFGSEPWRDLTTALINAVLKRPRGQWLEEVDLLNPYTQGMAIDDKLSILDIKARDQQGHLYNLEMQMLATAALSPRLLYYWSKLYSQQLSVGDDYTKLRPTILICFVNGELFVDRPDYHTHFRLLDASGQVCLTNDLAIHVLELPKFQRPLEELREPLDFWLYFLKNGAGLDADALPAAMDQPEFHKAMEVLKMLAQNDQERELYEGRLKAKRDMQTLDTMRRTLEAQLEAQTRTLEAQTRTLETRAQTLETQRDQWQQRYETANREVKRELAERIGLCQRLLRHPQSAADELVARSVEELRDQAERLECELTGGIKPA